MTREEAVEQLKWYFECDDGISANHTIKQAVKVAIEALKPPERKKGKWTLDFKHNTCRCSECGHTFDGGFDLDNSDNFCRFCGADMRG